LENSKSDKIINGFGAKDILDINYHVTRIVNSAIESNAALKDVSVNGGCMGVMELCTGITNDFLAVTNGNGFFVDSNWDVQVDKFAEDALKALKQKDSDDSDVRLTKRQKKALKKFVKAFYKLNEVWFDGDNDLNLYPMEEYPFKPSFDELPRLVSDWVEDILDADKDGVASL
jgi:hypothetical protein